MPFATSYHLIPPQTTLYHHFALFALSALFLCTCSSPSPADSPHDRMMDADMAKPLAMLDVRFTTTAVSKPPSAWRKLVQQLVQEN